MPVIEVEVGEDGSIGKLPDPIQKFFDKRFEEAYRKGADKTERALSPLTVDPVEMERLRTRDKALADVELREAERQKEYEKARQLRDEAAAKEKAEAVKAVEQRRLAAIDRLKTSLTRTIKATAKSLGARDESLDELERLLGAEVDLDDELNEFVRDASDPKKARVNDKGEKLSIEGLVAEYLRTHPHHVKAEPVQGGGARGGATFSGTRLATDDRSRIVADLERDPTVANLARGMATIGKRAS